MHRDTQDSSTYPTLPNFWPPFPSRQLPSPKGEQQRDPMENPESQKQSEEPQIDVTNTRYL